MSKTMVEIINEHATTTPRLDGKYICGAKGCDQVYPGVFYPDRIVVTAHVVNRLNSAGFGSKHEAWDEACGVANEKWVIGTQSVAILKAANPYPVTR